MLHREFAFYLRGSVVFFVFDDLLQMGNQSIKLYFYLFADSSVFQFAGFLQVDAVVDVVQRLWRDFLKRRVQTLPVKF